jgi:hypothetical protein
MELVCFVSSWSSIIQGQLKTVCDGSYSFESGLIAFTEKVGVKVTLRCKAL